MRSHDQPPEAPDQEPSARLSAELTQLRLSGAIFLRAEYTDSWAYDSLSAGDVAEILSPGAERVLLFHVVASGRCWISCADGERLWADAGDVIVLPYGDAHRMGGVGDADPVSVGTLVATPPWLEMPVIRHGGGGDLTNVVCGYLSSDDPLFDPRLRALPPVFVVTPPEGAASAWVQASIDYAVQQTAQVSATHIQAPTEMPRLLLMEILRLYLADAPAADHGWIKALHDPVLGPAMALLHADPARKWTVDDLAAAVHVSGSLLDERFRKVLDLAPIRYLTGWRMHLAEGLLASGDRSMAAVARQVGYDSEEAFSRAFKRERGMAPSVWRATVTR
jgi:AraC-like DNA-binding protein